MSHMMVLRCLMGGFGGLKIDTISVHYVAMGNLEMLTSLHYQHSEST